MMRARAVHPFWTPLSSFDGVVRCACGRPPRAGCMADSSTGLAGLCGKGLDSPMYVCRKMNNSQARTGHQRGIAYRVWVDAGQMMTTRTSNTQTQTRSSHKTHSQSVPLPLCATHPELAYT